MAASKPRWLQAITTALAVPENKGKIVYQVATVDSDHTPHVRTQVHRGFLIPKHAPYLPLLLTSSDVRSPKVVQMLANKRVELAWWMEGSQDQFRISGTTYVVGPPGSGVSSLPEDGSSPAVAALDDGGEDSSYSDSFKESSSKTNGSGKFDWEQKRRDVFEAMKPGMKASWCVPVAPGSPIASYDTPSSWQSEVPYLHELKTDEEKRNYEVALGNFALIVVEPKKIDWVQLGDKPNRRTSFVKTEEGEEWDEQILAP